MSNSFENCNSYQGGAIFVDLSNISINFCIFHNNSASIAGSIFILSPLICNLKNSLILFGKSFVECGGILIDSSSIYNNNINLEYLNFSNCISPSVSGCDIWNGKPFLNYNLFNSNKAFYKYGNIRTSSYNPNFSNFNYTLMINNSCLNKGGAYYGYWFNTQVNFFKCYFLNNFSGNFEGASIFIGNSQILCNIKNSFFSGLNSIELFICNKKSKILLSFNEFNFSNFENCK